MKKISLFLISSLFTIAVIAQTDPNANPTTKLAKPTTASKTSSASTGISKNAKKTVAGKKTTTHHVTPVKKSTTPAPAKNTPPENK